MTVPHIAAVVAGTAICFSPFILFRGGLVRNLAASVGLAVMAAAIIHVIAS